MNGQNGEFATNHFYLAAYRTLRGHQIISTAREGRFTSFIFARSPGLDADVADFHGGAMVPVRDYVLEVLRVKKFIPKPGELERREWRAGNVAR